MDEVLDKSLALITSRRFVFAILGVLTVLFEDMIGLGPDQAKLIAGIIAAWIMGDSITKTERPGVPLSNWRQS